MTLSTLIGLTGISLLISASLLRILLALKIDKKIAYLIVSGLFFLSFMPVYGYTLNQYIRGIFNDLSITSIIILLFYFIKPEAPSTDNRSVFITIVIVGLFFYPAALGLGPLDPYAGGYLNKAHGILAPLLFISALAALMIIAYFNKQQRLLLCLVVATMAFQLSLLESNNLWDYLFDPLIYFYALFLLIYQWKTKLIQKKRTPN